MDERARKHAAYMRLNRQIYHRYDDPDSGRVPSKQKGEEIEEQLHELIVDEILSELSLPNASANEIAGGITAVQGPMTYKPFVTLFQINGVKTLAAGYLIAQGDQAIPDTQPYLEFYDQANGSWVRRAEAPTRSDFRGHTFSVHQMNSPFPTEAWFLAWGKPIGNPGVPLDVRLYAFDGNTARTIWKREDLAGGVITVSNDSITLDYDRAYHSTERVHEILHVTPNGLQ